MKTEKELHDSIEEHISGLINDFNRLDLDSDQIATIISDNINKSHRTLQQTFWSVFQKAIVKYAQYGRFDLRNEASKDWAKAVKEIDVYIPFI